MKSKSFTLLMAIFMMAGVSANAQETEDSRGRSYDAPYLPDANITVDGIADEDFWSAIDYTEVDTIVSGEDNWEGEDDMHSKFKVFWDEEFLYVFVTAKDDVIEEGTDHDCDNIEWFFNVDKDNEDAYGNLTASQLRMNVKNEDNLVGGKGFSESAGDATGYEFTTNETDDGWDVEGKIPWGLIYDAQVQTTAHFDEIEVGTMIKFDINIGDGDGEGRETILTWNSKGTDAWNNVANFGDLNLADEVTSIQDVEIDSDISVSSTVVEEDLNVSVSNASEFKSITLISLGGQTVKTVSNVSPDNTISVGDLPKGLYVLKLEAVNNAVKAYKIIKK